MPPPATRPRRDWRPALHIPQGIPQLGTKQHDEARRLVTAIDVAYDLGTQARAHPRSADELRLGGCGRRRRAGPGGGGRGGGREGGGRGVAAGAPACLLQWHCSDMTMPCAALRCVRGVLVAGGRVG